MSKPCNKCGEPIEFERRNGRWIPMQPDMKEEHRGHCAAQKGQVPDRLKRPSGHHTSQSRIRRFLQCQRRAYFVDALDLARDDESTPEMQAGKLVHGCLEFVIVQRHAEGKLGEPVLAEHLLAALEVVVGREAWGAESLALARAILSRQAPIDLSFAMTDEHGVICERQFQLPVGDGVIVGGVLDLAERVGDEVFLVDWKTSARRDPEPEKSPQAGLYLAWGRAVFGPRVRFVLRYLALDGQPSEEVFWTQELEDDAKAIARAFVTKCRTQAQDEEAWPASPGAWCASCAFATRCKPLQFRIAAAKDEGGIPLLDLEGIARELHLWEPIAAVASARVNALRAAGKDLALKALGSDSGRLMAGPYPVRLKSISKKSYEVKASTYLVLEVEDPVPVALPPPTVDAVSARVLEAKVEAPAGPPAAPSPEAPAVLEADPPCGCGKCGGLPSSECAARSAPRPVAGAIQKWLAGRATLGDTRQGASPAPSSSSGAGGELAPPAPTPEPADPWIDAPLTDEERRAFEEAEAEHTAGRTEEWLAAADAGVLPDPNAPPPTRAEIRAALDAPLAPLSDPRIDPAIRAAAEQPGAMTVLDQPLPLGPVGQAILDAQVSARGLVPDGSSAAPDKPVPCYSCAKPDLLAINMLREEVKLSNGSHLWVFVCSAACQERARRESAERAVHVEPDPARPLEAKKLPCGGTHARHRWGADACARCGAPRKGVHRDVKPENVVEPAPEAPPPVPVPAANECARHLAENCKLCGVTS